MKSPSKRFMQVDYYVTYKNGVNFGIILAYLISKSAIIKSNTFQLKYKTIEEELQLTRFYISKELNKMIKLNLVESKFIGNTNTYILQEKNITDFMLLQETLFFDAKTNVELVTPLQAASNTVYSSDENDAKTNVELVTPLQAASNTVPVLITPLQAASNTVYSSSDRELEYLTNENRLNSINKRLNNINKYPAEPEKPAAQEQAPSSLLQIVSCNEKEKPEDQVKKIYKMKNKKIVTKEESNWTKFDQWIMTKWIDAYPRKSTKANMYKELSLFRKDKLDWTIDQIKELCKSIAKHTKTYVKKNETQFLLAPHNYISAEKWKEQILVSKIETKHAGNAESKYDEGVQEFLNEQKKLKSTN